MKRIAGAAFGFLLALGGVAPPASAAVLVTDLLNTIEFSNFENLFTPVEGDGGLTYVRKAEGDLPAVGDILAGIINSNNLTVGGVTTSFDDLGFQLSGIFWQEVSAASFLEDPDVDGAGPDEGQIHLTLTAPTLATSTTLFCESGAMADCFSTGLGAGEMFAFYLQTGLGTTPFESNGAMAQDVLVATDGSLFFTLGAGVSAADVGPGVTYSHLEFNGATPLFPVLSFGGLNVQTNGSGFSYVGIPGPLLLVDPDGLVGTNHILYKSSITLNPNRLGPPFGVNAPWFFRSDDPAYVLPVSVIPEVSSLWMLGMGMSGFGFLRRRKFLG